MSKFYQQNLTHVRKCHGCRQEFSSNDLGYDFKNKEFHCFRCNHNRYIDEGPEDHPQCKGCYERFPITELEVDESTKEYFCIDCNHHRYVDINDRLKTCDFCDTLCDPLDVGECEDESLICGDCWIKSL